MLKMVWIRADHLPGKEDRKALVTTALESNFMKIVVREDDLEDFEKLGKFDPVFIRDGKLTFSSGGGGEYIEVQDSGDIDMANELVGKVEHVVVSTKNWKVIPVENLIAAYQGSGTKLFVEVGDAEEAKLFFETLEVGVDGVVLNTSEPAKILELRKLVEEHSVGQVELVPAKITEIKSLGTGDRVCIDTCSMLKVGEGMLIGSQSSGLFLIHSESLESEYVDSRPFRVNAGPVHSYVLTLDDKTKYLSDLKVGDTVLAVDENGKTRPVIIGRVKIEKRPLMLLEAEAEDQKFNIILQNAETIRLVSEGKPVSIVDLKVGDTIQLWIGSGGRHFGMKVDESIIEK
jgi:3-dehydroquinate synthase II